MASDQPGTSDERAAAASTPTAAARLWGELVAHLPFSVSSSAIGLVLAGMICILAPPIGGSASEHPSAGHPTPVHVEEPPGTGHEPDRQHQANHEHDLVGDLFHLFHPVHMFFSAAATTAMFWRYERRLIKAMV
ncbi:MAG: hypothetical protein ACYSUQ_14680, partial [Planctomycetota bacterium]